MKATPLYHLAHVGQFIFGVIQTLLLLRFFLKLFAANTAAGFTRFINEVTAGLVAPFQRVFPSDRIDENVFEWSTLLAMLVYWIVTITILHLLTMGRDIDEGEAERSL